jgi:hypothetical protein
MDHPPTFAIGGFPNGWELSQPGDASRRYGYLFEREHQLRPLTAVVSAEILGAAQATPRRDFLLGLLHRPGIKTLRYADAGPPADHIRPYPETDEMYGVDGWILLAPLDEPVRSSSLGVARYVLDDRWNRQLVSGADFVNLAGGDSERARADALAGMVAEDVDADIIVTTRPTLLDPPFVRFLRGMVALPIEQALALVGLYLRQQGQFIVGCEPDGRYPFTYNRGLFWWVAARDQLPSGWHWMSACVEESATSGDDTLTYLAGSLHQRVSRALQARDAIHAMLLVPQNNDTADEALSELDVLLISLMGAMDAAARVAHQALALPGPQHGVGWQRAGWIAAVVPKAPNLATIVASGSPGQAALTVLRLLRNTVHGEALQSLGVSEAGRGRTRTMVGLPRAEQVQLLDAFDVLGGAEEWGVEEKVPGRLHADIPRLVEHLVTAIMRTLDRLLLEMPVDALPNVTGALEERILTGNDDTFALQYRERIRWQLALPDPPSY